MKYEGGVLMTYSHATSGKQNTFNYRKNLLKDIILIIYC